MVHALKTLPEFYAAVRTGEKTFEVRNNDRKFKVGDYLALNELDDTRMECTGRSLIAKITYILDNQNYCKKDFVVIGFVLCSLQADNEMFRQPIRELGGKQNE